MVFWLLSMLATRDKDDMSRTLLAMSSSQESCLAMRKSGCLPLLIQILHDSDGEPGPPESPAGAKDARMRANAALHNIVFSQPDEGQAKKEMRVLHVLEQIRSYSETCWDWLQMQSRERGRGPEGSAGTGRGDAAGVPVCRRRRVMGRGSLLPDPRVKRSLPAQAIPSFRDSPRSAGAHRAPDLPGHLRHHEALLRRGVPAGHERAG